VNRFNIVPGSFNTSVIFDSGVVVINRFFAGIRKYLGFIYQVLKYTVVNKH